MTGPDWNRRDLLAISLAGGVAAAATAAGSAAPIDSGEGVPPSAPGRSMDVVLTINGAPHRLSKLDANTTLLDCLRDYLDLTGSKKGCGLGSTRHSVVPRRKPRRSEGAAPRRSSAIPTPPSPRPRFASTKATCNRASSTMPWSRTPPWRDRTAIA